MRAFTIDYDKNISNTCTSIQTHNLLNQTGSIGRKMVAASDVG